MKCLLFEISAFFIVINFHSCISGEEISSKIDFDEDQRSREPLNPGNLQVLIDVNRGFRQQQMPRGTNYNGGHLSYRSQDGNFVRNDKLFLNKRQENARRDSGNSRPVVNYIRVFMDGQNPSPCENESCNLTLVKKQSRNGKILTNVYINMDETQIDTEGGETMTIKVTPFTQDSSTSSFCDSSGNCFPIGPYKSKCLSGNCNFGNSERCSSGNCPPNSANPENLPKFYNNPSQIIPEHPPVFSKSPGRFQSSSGIFQPSSRASGRFPGDRFYPQRPGFLSSYQDPESQINAKEFVDDKIAFPLSKTNNEPSKA